jgi:para-nitrobenzyl esterase
MQPSVETASGRVQGVRQGEASVFRGIPYAAAPVGPRRFAPPASILPWAGVRDATRFGPIPPQSDDALSARLGLSADLPQSEDCLTLNVFTPAADSGRRPVMVWLPGGAFINGAAAAPPYAGDRLACAGDVVVVTVSYRVGALGFLHLAEIGAAAGMPASNLGLLDQIAALGWVRDHIGAFGGDPGRVAVFGESAGAGSLVALLAMPAARGLFGRAIVQSAAPEGWLRAEEATRRAHKLLGLLGLDASEAAGLRSLPLEALLDAQERCAADGPYETGMLFAPVVDGEALPDRPLSCIASGSAREVELMIGTTLDEMRLYRLQGGFPFTDELLPAVVASQLPGEDGQGRPRAGVVVEAYRRLRGARGQGTSAPELFEAIQTDLSLRMPSTALAERHARHQPATRVYLFDWPSPLEGDLGACHALDIPFTFGTLDLPGMREFAGAGPAARELSEHLRAAWCAFARCGDPGHPGIGPWPAYEPLHRSTMILGETCGIRESPYEDERVLFERIGWPP